MNPTRLILIALCAASFLHAQPSSLILQGANDGSILFTRPTGIIQLKCDGTSVICSFSGNTMTLTSPGSSGMGITSLNGLNASSQSFNNANDTNITLSITSLTATHTFAVGWTGTLAATRGGSGVASPTTHLLLVGQGASPFASVAAGTVGQVLVSNGVSADPSFVDPVVSTLNNAGQTGALQVGGCVATNNNISSACFPNLIAGSDYGGTPKIQSWKVDSSGIGQVNVVNSSLPVTGTFWQATQPVSGTVTSNIGTTNGLALDASVTALQVAQGSTTAGQHGEIIQGAVTTAAPSYTTAQTSPLSLTTAGALRVDNSAVTQPVSGTVTVTGSLSPTTSSTFVGNLIGTPGTIGTASTTFLAANSSRKRFTIQNVGTTDLFVLLGGGPASLSNYTFALPAGGYNDDGSSPVWVDILWTGAIQVISSAASGRVTGGEFN